MSDDTKKIKVTLDLIKEMTCSLVGYKIEDFILIQELPVDDQGKYQHEGFVFLHVPSRKFYRYFCTRSGSYFSDYHYQYGEDKESNVELTQVRIVPVETFKWVAVK